MEKKLDEKELNSINGGNNPFKDLPPRYSSAELKKLANGTKVAIYTKNFKYKEDATTVKEEFRMPTFKGDISSKTYIIQVDIKNYFFCKKQ